MSVFRILRSPRRAVGLEAHSGQHQAVPRQPDHLPQIPAHADRPDTCSFEEEMTGTLKKQSGLEAIMRWIEKERSKDDGGPMLATVTKKPVNTSRVSTTRPKRLPPTCQTPAPALPFSILPRRPRWVFMARSLRNSAFIVPFSPTRNSLISPSTSMTTVMPANFRCL